MSAKSPFYTWSDNVRVYINGVEHKTYVTTTSINVYSKEFDIQIPDKKVKVIFDGTDSGEPRKEFDVYCGGIVVLPKSDFKTPENKKFIGWKINDREYYEGKAIRVFETTEIKAIWCEEIDNIKVKGNTEPIIGKDPPKKDEYQSLEPEKYEITSIKWYKVLEKTDVSMSYTEHFHTFNKPYLYFIEINVDLKEGFILSDLFNVSLNGKSDNISMISKIKKENKLSYTGCKIDTICFVPTASYKVIFKDYNDVILSSQTIEYGCSAIQPKNPKRLGYKFKGWDKKFDNITEDLIIKAQYEKVIYPTSLKGCKVKEPKRDSIKLSWSKQTGITGYKIYSYNYKKKKWEYVGKTSSNSYTIKKLKAATTYKYRVRAYKTIDGTQYYGSYTSSIKTSTQTKKPSISKLTTKSKKVTIKWKKVSGASGYQIYMATSKNGNYSKIKTITKGSTTSYTKSKLKKNKKYYFKIRTYRTVDGKKVYSSYSSIKSIKVK